MTRCVKVATLRWQELANLADAFMSADKSVKDAWLKYVCQREQDGLLLTDRDWPLAFFVWYHGRKS